MKFSIQVVHPKLGKIDSEVYDSDEEKFETIRKQLTDPDKNVLMLDFYTKSGDYVIIKENIFKECLVYFKKSK